MTNEEMMQIIRAAAAKYGVKSHQIITSGTGTQRVRDVRFLLIDEFVRVHEVPRKQISEVFGYSSHWWANHCKKRLGYSAAKVGAAAKEQQKRLVEWPQTVQQIIAELGGVPPKSRKPANVERRKKIIDAIFDRCPGITYSEVGRIMGTDHSTIMYFRSAGAYKTRNERNRKRHAENRAALRAQRASMQSATI